MDGLSKLVQFVKEVKMRRNMSCSIIAATVVSLMFGSVFANPFYVDALRADDSGDGLSWATAKKTIQAAVDLAGVGHSVVVTNGIYTASTGNQVVSIPTNITLRSVSGYAGTIIDGQGVRRGITVRGGGIADGFTVTNGVVVGTSDGGGVYVKDTGSTVRNCLIVKNSAPANSRYGGGAYVSTGGKLLNCIVRGNTASTHGRGGGVALYWGGIMDNCLIVGNSVSGSSGKGGGVYLAAYSDWLRNCTVVENTSVSGGGGGVCNGGDYNGNVQNCIVYNNKGDEDIYNNGAAKMTIGNSCYGTIDGTVGAGVSNITANPMFVNLTAGNYRPAYGSPCINSGMTIATVTNDLAGSARPFSGTAYDMGAYEYVHTPRTLYVSPGGDHTTFTSWATAANDIQAALNAAHTSGGDTVLVSNHTYTASTGAQVVNVSMPVTLRSMNGYAQTIIDGQGARGGLSVSSPYAVVEGFTITKGYINGTAGGGVSINNNSSGFMQSGAVVQECLIVGNAIINQWGGGAWIGPNGGVLRRSIINNNTNNLYGGGLGLYYGGLAENCLIVGNNCGGGYGGGVCMEGSSTLLRNCTIVGNFGSTTNRGAGISNLGGVSTWDGRGTVQNCIIYGNQADNVDVRNGTGSVGRLNFYSSCIGTIIGDYGPVGTGNISTDPLYLDVANGIYRLLVSSPCIDTGMTIAAVTEDLDGNPRPLNGNSDGIIAYDMGAYENMPPQGTVILLQ